MKKPKRLTAAQRLAAVGIEQLCERIEAGETQRELAKALGEHVAEINKFLNLPEHAERFRVAKEASAEAWLDRGLEVVGSSLRKKGPIDPAAARAYAQECARRAALRNPRYVEKTAHEHSGPGGSALTVVVNKLAS